MASLFQHTYVIHIKVSISFQTIYFITFLFLFLCHASDKCFRRNILALTANTLTTRLSSRNKERRKMFLMCHTRENKRGVFKIEKNNILTKSKIARLCPNSLLPCGMKNFINKLTMSVFAMECVFLLI
jgi:hypothetical protein